MATTSTKLYATQNNGGSPSVTIAEIGALVGGATVPAASTSTAGIAKQAAHIANAASPFASLTVAADAYNALLAALQTAGIMAAS
jgi:hypothetical protein